MKEQVSEQDLANTKAFAGAIMEAITPHLLKVAAAASGNRVEAVGEMFASAPFTSELVAGETFFDPFTERRIKFWSDAYLAFGADKADAALIQFDKRFPLKVQA